MGTGHTPRSVTAQDFRASRTFEGRVISRVASVQVDPCTLGGETTLRATATPFQAVPTHCENDMIVARKRTLSSLHNNFLDTGSGSARHRLFPTTLFEIGSVLSHLQGHATSAEAGPPLVSREFNGSFET